MSIRSILLPVSLRLQYPTPRFCLLLSARVLFESAVPDTVPCPSGSVAECEHPCDDDFDRDCAIEDEADHIEGAL